MLTTPWPGGLVSRYVAKPQEIEALHSYIKDLRGGNIVVNVSGEILPQEYPTYNDVARYCNSGGVYVDYCGWPMFYDRYGQVNKSQFRYFLTAIGADPNYWIGFMEPWTWTTMPCDPFYGYKYPRGWLAPIWLDYRPEAVIVASYEAPTNSCSSTGTGQPQLYVYSVVGVRAKNNGWYFYGFGQLDAESVDPTVYAGFIEGMIKTAPPIPSPSPTPPPAPSPTPPPAPSPTPSPPPPTTPGGIVNPMPPEVNYALYLGAAGGIVVATVGAYLVARGTKA